MACRISELVIDAATRPGSRPSGANCSGFVELEQLEDGIEIGPPGVGFGGLEPTIVFQSCPALKTAKLGLHVDVSPADGDQGAELSRLLAAGARMTDIGQRGDEGWHVLADPEGNEFCLLRRQLADSHAS